MASARPPRLHHVALLCSLVSLAIAESPLFAQVQQLAFDHLTVMDGLSNANVMTIYQDHRGFMWFGTMYGLNRYDGYSIRSLAYTSITALCEDSSGYLWIGSSSAGRLFCLSLETDSIITFKSDAANPHSLSSEGIRSIYQDPDGTLWIGTDKGLDRYDRKTGEFTRFGGISIPALPVLSIADDHAGNLWLGMRVGLYRFNKPTHQSTRIGTWSVPGGVQVVSSAGGTIWVAADTEGLQHFDPSSQILQRDLKSGSKVNTKSLMLDKAGHVWVGTTNAGLEIYNPASGVWQTYQHRSSDPLSLSSNRINTFYADRSGNTWVGTPAGIDKLARWRKQFFYLRHNTDNPNSPPQGPITAVCEDHAGYLWMCSIGGGVTRWDRATGMFRSYLNLHGWVKDILADRSGKIWIATTSGLIELDPFMGSFTQYQHDPRNSRSLPSSDITCLHEDPDGTIWVGSGKFSISRVDRRRRSFTSFAIDSASEESRKYPMLERIRFIYRDRAGGLWVAPTDNDIILFNERTGATRTFAHPKSEDFWLKSIYLAYEDKKGRFWVGTDMGMDLLDRSGGRFSAAFRGPSRTSGYAGEGILEDDHGKLWVVTPRYLIRYDPEGNSIHKYGIEDGFPRAYDHMTGSGGFCKTRAGEMVCGVGDGVVIFHPDSIKDDPEVPRMAFTDFKIFGQTVAVGPDSPLQKTITHTRSIVLPYDQNSISFEYSALSFTTPSTYQYSHKLEKFDQDWSPAHNQHETQYTNLTPGTYVFRVRGSNSDGVRSEKDLAVSVVIVPAYWQTSWFRILGVIAFAAGIAFLTRLRYVRQMEIERLRARIAHDLHDEVGSSLSSIALLTDLVHDSIPGARPERKDLQEISLTARRTADTMRDIVWIINPKNDRFENLVDRMKDSARSLLGAVPFTFTSNLSDLGARAHIEFRRNLLLAYKEMLHNVAKHAGAHRVSIDLRQRGNQLTLRVSDDGAGFIPHTVTPGNGMQTMQQRARNMHGSLRIEGAPGVGTTVELTARIP
jgi:ligand-binding sensor domain-containing protein/signal transduction histidine kinase